MAIDYTVLKTEIDSDPKALGYAGKTDPPVADLLNTVGLSGEEIDQETLDGHTLNKCVVFSEYEALTDAQRAGWATIILNSGSPVDIADPAVKAQIGAIWGSGTTTRDNLLALATRDCSRAEALFGAGVGVTHLDVANARLYY